MLSLLVTREVNNLYPRLSISQIREVEKEKKLCGIKKHDHLYQSVFISEVEVNAVSSLPIQLHLKFLLKGRLYQLCCGLLELKMMVFFLLNLIQF